MTNRVINFDKFFNLLVKYKMSKRKRKLEFEKVSNREIVEAILE